MRYRLIYLILALTLVVGLAALAARDARAQDPTIPTRTPTPGAPPPNPTATNDDNSPDPPAPTNTTAPGATALATVAAGATSQGTATAAAASSLTPAALATTTRDTRQADTCDDSPFITAVGVVYVYEGPGGDYNIGATLQDGETRRIVGRAGYADWWVIMLTPTETGWVDDEDVTVSGNTGLAPVIDPPTIGGATPTRGTPWNPTPPPFPTCPATATATATPTATPTSTATPTATVQAAISAATATPAAESAAATTATAAPLTDVAPGTGLDPRGSESARADSPTSSVNLILPLAGLALIAGGIVMALMARNRGAKKPDEPQ